MRQFRDSKYWVDKEGNLYGPRFGFSKPMKPHLNQKGYYDYHLGAFGSQTMEAHRIIFETFKGPIEAGLVIDHIDGDKTNNQLFNLQAITPKENVRKGNVPKVTPAIVNQIRTLYSTRKYSAMQLASAFNISETAVFRIVKKHTWEDIQKDEL